MSGLFLRLSVPSGPPYATERIMTMLTAALAAAVAVSLGLGLSLAIALTHPAPQHSPRIAASGAARPEAGQVGASSDDGLVRVIPRAGSMAAESGTTLAIPPVSGTRRSVIVVDAVTGAVLAGELSGDAATWHCTAALVAGRAYRVTVASTRSDGSVAVIEATITAPG